MVRRLLGIDVGGTFTDLVLWDGAGLRVAKTPSTPPDFIAGIRAGLEQLGLVRRDAATPRDFLTELTHGSTVATNALLERRGERVAFVTTRGFEDLLQIGRQDRPKLYALHVSRAPALVDPADCFGVCERIGADGRVVTPLADDELDAILAEIAARGIEAVALCFLFGYLNPVHERRAVQRAAVRGLKPHAACEILPQHREYERASTTVVNAYVAGLMSRYLNDLGALAREYDVASVRVMQSNGGQISAQDASRHAVRTILSGPAGGVVAAARVARELGLPRIITYDMGGTSTDVALWDGDLPIRTDAICGGAPIGVPMLAIHTIGSGGGSIARLDAGGALRVGPESAGARPGPACYGLGDRPTVTDAHVVLGRIRPEFFMGGAMPIEPGRAFAAYERLGAAMGCSAVDAARAVLRVCESAMEHAVSVVSAQRGYDPEEFWLLSFGGAGGLHACALADALGMAGVVVPAHAGLLSALGLMMSDIVIDLAQAAPPAAAGIDLRSLQRLYAGLMDAAAAATTREGYDLDDSECDRLADMRYAGQSYEITVPVESLTDAARLCEPFHVAHQRRYGFAWRERPVEIVTARIRVRIPNASFAGRPMHRPGKQPTPVAAEAAGCDVQEALRAAVWIDEAVAAPFYRREAFGPAAGVTGPAIIVENHATTFLPCGWRAVGHAAGHLVLTRA